MHPVEDRNGRRFLLVKRSEQSWLVRDPRTGKEIYRNADDLTVLEDAAPLAVATAGVPESVLDLVTAVPDRRALGLVIDVVDHGPVAVRDLLGETTLCESDLHGLLAELTAAGLFEETRVAGERGYDAKPAAVEAVAHLRDDEGRTLHDRTTPD